MAKNDIIEVEFAEYIELCTKARMWDFYSEKAEFVVDGEGEDINPTDKISMLTNKTVEEEDQFFEDLDEEFADSIEEESCEDCAGCHSCEMSDVENEEDYESCSGCNCGCARKDNENDPKDS